MDTYLKNMERTETVSVEDLKRDLLSEFSDIKAVTQDSSTLLEREHLQVYLRIRPFTSPEMEDGEAQDCVTIQHPDTVLLKPPRASISGRQSDKNVPQTAQRFQFSQVYGPEASQKDMFDGTVKSLVKDVLEGRNSLVFTYGVTNAGKTFTFIGPEGKSGILPRSLNMIFSSIEGHVFTHMSLKPHRCREYLTLSEEQQKEEASSKRSLLRLLKENDGHKSLSQLSSKTSLEGSMRDMDGLVNEESFSLDLGVHTEFSVWVSFCEIYNENIHDLLEPLPSGSVKRTILRLSQDVKGNAFIKDLKWVQVNSADEALRVLKLGKRNQSISSTKLNHLSSRSHSIFSIRILRIEDVGVPRFQTVSELSLCDLAGSERCAKTQNKGERLKEAANINTSLLSLGKCINALRNNQQARQHVPFRESKLTHYLQGFFTGRGKACMIVNINQCASMYDETLNVLKFSAVAQKVVVLTTKIIPVVVKKSAREVSFIINNADRQMIRRSSMVRWDTSRLEDVQEDAVSEEEESMMEDTFQEDEGKETVILDKDEYEAQVMFLEEVQGQLEREKASNLILEADIREEVTKEFTELFSQMEQDYKERLAKERELVEERCERRLEIFKNLIRKNSNEEEDEDAGQPKTEGQLSLDGMLDFMCGDLAGIRQNAEEAHSCLVTSNNLQQATITLSNLERKVTELTEELDKTQGLLALKTQELESRCGQLNELEETKGTLLCHEQRMREMVEMCGQKDEMISRLQTSLDQHVKDTSKDKVLINTIREEILEFQKNCTCSDSHGRGSRVESRKRRQEGEGLGDVDGQPPQKKGPVGDADIPDSPLHGAVDKVRGQLDRMVDLERKCQALEFCNRELKTELKEAERCRDNALVEKDRLSVELIALQGNTEEQQSKLLAVELQLAAMEAKLVAAEKEHSTTKADLSMESQLAEANKAHEALRVAQARLAELDCEVREKTTVTEALRQDVARLKQEAEASCALRSDLQVVRAELCDARQESESRRARVQLLELQLKATTHTQHTQHTQPSEVLTLREEEVEERKVENAKKEGLLLGKEEELSQREADLIGQQRGRRESQEPKRDETETESNLSNREAQLMQKEATLAEKEAQLSGLERSLKEVQERLEEGEMQAVQQARRREVERRRELLAVAEEAIAQKEAELKKREEEVDRLKEEIRSCSDKMKGLTVDLQRREEDSSDLKEKLTDSKKQIQQVQREISSMRDAEKSLRQKFADLEKSKAQLQSDVSCRDRTIQQLKSERASDPKAEEHLRLYRKACEDLQARERVMEDMRLALTEQEETQTQLDVELEARDEHIRELTQELEVLKGLLLEQRTSRDFLPSDAACSDDVTQAREEATRAQESFKMVVEKHQAERRKWLEEKMDLIRLAKEAEERRNQDMRRFADGRERHARQQTELESLSARLSAREQEMEAWRRERDTLVSALEVQLQKLLSSNAEKDEQIQALRCSDTRCTPEGAGGKAEELQRLLAEREAELCGLKEQLHTTLAQRTSLASQHRDSSTQTLAAADPVVPRPLDRRALNHRDGPRGSMSSQGSSGSGPSVLDSSQISTETGHRSRFPRPELEISFSPLQPDRFALKRQGDASAVTVKIARTARKRKSGEMEKKRSSRLSKAKPKVAHHQQTPQDGIENRRNTRTRNTPRLMAHEEEPSPAFHVKAPQSSQSSLRGKKEGTFQKIGDFLQSSPTFLGSKAKRIMGLVSGKSPDGEGGGSLSLKPKRYKRKLYRPQISSPLDIPVHPIVGRDPEEKESDHLIIKRRLRARTGK